MAGEGMTNGSINLGDVAAQTSVSMRACSRCEGHGRYQSACEISRSATRASIIEDAFVIEFDYALVFLLNLR
jgi:hypothetical protein